MHRFENIKVFKFRIPFSKKKLAFCLPGIGIFVHPEDLNHQQLLAHEFGHILQARKWGFLFFYFRIVPISIWSAIRHNKNGFNHFNTWTEWTANQLAQNYFSNMEWDVEIYKIKPDAPQIASNLPKGVNWV
ncbi:MAG TPA: hypothetical protein PKH65_04925 [Bacteroidia bacterium]|nr:hypothetical protein [Bacteroidia bacterium]HNT80005.1 hypothetical protein [Bacteroidia bacterium]